MNSFSRKLSVTNRVTTVTHVLLLPTSHKMTLQCCYFAQAVSAKPQMFYYYYILTFVSFPSCYKLRDYSLLRYCWSGKMTFFPHCVFMLRKTNLKSPFKTCLFENGNMKGESQSPYVIK